MNDRFWLLQAFSPESFEYCSPNWQVFWLTHFLRPSHPVQTVQWHKVAKNHLSLQLRVQLRNLTGFPLDTCLKVSPIREQIYVKNE